MSEPNSFSTNDILDALRKIWQGGHTGHLSFPYGTDIVTLVFAGGILTGMDTATSRKHFGSFLTGRGIDINTLLAGATSTVSLSTVQSYHNLFVEFWGHMLTQIVRPDLGMLISFTGKEVPPAPDGSLAMGIPALMVPFFDRWLEENAVGGLIPDLAVSLRVVPGYLARVRGLPLTPRQGFILSRLQDGLRLREFIQSCGMPEDQILRAVLTFEFFGLISLARKPAAPPRVDAVPAARVQPECKPPPQPDPAPPIPARSFRNEPPEPSPAAEKIPAELLEEINDLAIIAQKGTYYEILDVFAHAEADEIKHKFVELTKKFHPDKFQKYNDPGLLSKLDAIFTQISTAYETLKDPAARLKYNERTGADTATPTSHPAPAAVQESHGDAKHDETKPPGRDAAKTPAYENPEHKAQQHFIHGREALKAMKFHDATEHFRESVRLMPDVAEYQYMLGKALSMNPQRHREAEERLLRAVELKPDRIELLLELGRFYEKIKLKIRSEKYYRRILELDPDNKEARMVLGIKSKSSMNLKNFMKLDLKDLLKSDHKDS